LDHLDIYALMPHQSLDSVLYFITFIEDATRNGRCGLIKHAQKRLAMVENQIDRKLRCLQSNKGEEYKSNEFIKFCREHNVKWKFMAPYNPEQSDIAKRMNQTIQQRIVANDTSL
jgi:transposase InsO family protein